MHNPKLPNMRSVLLLTIPLLSSMTMASAADWSLGKDRGKPWVSMTQPIPIPLGGMYPWVGTPGLAKRNAMKG